MYVPIDRQYRLPINLELAPTGTKQATNNRTRGDPSALGQRRFSGHQYLFVLLLNFRNTKWIIFDFLIVFTKYIVEHKLKYVAAGEHEFNMS